jgi:hypothetical protein
MDIINAKKEDGENQRNQKISQAKKKRKESSADETRMALQKPMPSHEGCIIVQVAASQLTSSKLCSMLNPIEERQSKLPSPST